MCVSMIAGGGSAYTLFLLSDRQPEPISATDKPKSWKIYRMTLVEHNILLFYGDQQAIKDLKLSACSVPLSCYLDDVMWGLWNNYNTYIVNLMPVRGHVPTKFELSGRYTSFWINIRTPHQHCRNPIGRLNAWEAGTQVSLPLLVQNYYVLAAMGGYN